jgi:hypothetical protein
MGAADFTTTATGKTADEAFRAAVAEAKRQHGHRSYTGSIAEKRTFIEFNADAECAKTTGRLRTVLAEGGPWDGSEYVRSLVTRVGYGEVRALADALLVLEDSRISEKWGPAGCLHLGEDQWLFFGVAST